jgi:hypothetical protein
MDALILSVGLNSQGLATQESANAAVQRATPSSSRYCSCERESAVLCLFLTVPYRLWLSVRRTEMGMAYTLQRRPNEKAQASDVDVVGRDYVSGEDAGVESSEDRSYFGNRCFVESVGGKNTMHYTIETDDMIFFADYIYKPGQHSNSHPPDIAVNALTKIAISGKHAYVLDVTGKEVKLHIVRKTKK